MISKYHLDRWRIGLLLFVVILSVICSGCAAKPEPKSWLEIEMTKPEYCEKLSKGVKMFFSNPRAREQFELIIMIKQWEAEDTGNN